MKKLFCIVIALLVLLSGCTVAEPAETTMSEYQAQAILQQRRDTAEAHMRYMMSVLWQTDVELVYSTNVNSLGTNMDEASGVIRLEAGKLYSGMPYTHGSGSAEAFLSFGQPDKNGIYQLQGLDSAFVSGGNGLNANNTARLSNDCADAVNWAWSQVGHSFTFTVTQNMTADRGCLPVGDYVFEGATYKKTRDVVKENGEAVMYSAYACLQKADAVVTFNGSGHAMMISQVYVKQSNGAVDPTGSYVLVHEQFTGNYKNEVTYVDETTGRTVYCLGGVDRKYTFEELYKKGYLPVTIQELIDPAPVEEPELVDSIETPDASHITEGTISCMGKIGMVTVTITDAQGEVVQQATCFPREAEHYMFHMDNFTKFEEQPLIRGSLDVDALAAGSYHCKVECTIGTGAILTARDFDFTAE